MKVKSVLLSAGLLLCGGAILNGVVSGLSYQNNVTLEFDFSPALGITLSSNDIHINELAPGTMASSNAVVISVATNNLAGYQLSATVGDGVTYTNNSLTNTSAPGTTKPTFASIPVSSTPVTTFATENTWGYTLDSTNYYGLAYLYASGSENETWTVINATTNAAGTAATEGCVGACGGTNQTTFKIGAYASSTQAMGDYTNVIQFSVIANPVELESGT